jgi:hypothetical protein
MIIIIMRIKRIIIIIVRVIITTINMRLPVQQIGLNIYDSYCFILISIIVVIIVYFITMHCLRRGGRTNDCCLYALRRSEAGGLL